MDDLRNSLPSHIDGQVGIVRVLVDVVDTGEALDLTSTGPSIETLAVSRLAVLERGSDVDEEEVATRTTALEHMLLGSLSRAFMRSNGSCDDSCTSASELTSNVGDSLDVLVSVFSRETEFCREFLADGFAEEEGDASATLLVEDGLEGAGDGVFTRVVQTGEEDDESLLVSWWVALAEDLDDFPVSNIQ